MTWISIVAHTTAPAPGHAWSPPIHPPPSPLNCPSSWGVHTWNYMKHSTDCCLNLQSVTLHCYRSSIFAPCFHPLRPREVSKPALWVHICWSLPHIPSVKSQIWSQPCSLGDQTEVTTHCYIRRENCARLTSLILCLYTPSLGMHITLTQSLALTCDIHSPCFVLTTSCFHSC